MENDKKEEWSQRDQPETSWLGYASSTNNLPSEPGKAIKAFEKNLEGLENLVKLFKSDVSKMFDISDPNFPSSSINASPEKWSLARKNCWTTFDQFVRRIYADHQTGLCDRGISHISSEKKLY